MCGILGFVGKSSDFSLDRFRTALDMLRHRGPDDWGIHHAALPDGSDVALGHRRLSILDLSESGHQPMISPRSKAVIVYNGELYNFIDIRDRLEGKGYQFRSTGDTEVVLAAYDEWGEDCLRHFNGMFGFGIYDPSRQRVFLARDRVGIKPLYYCLGRAGLGFASELTALLATGVGRISLSADALANFFAYGFFPRDLTAVTAHYKLRPAHCAVYDLKTRRTTVRQYWDVVDFVEAEEFQEDENDLADRLENLLTDSVRRMLISDVPLGAFLSGGIDSSLVVSLMTKVSRERARTFSIGFTVPEKDEAPYAKAIAGHLGTEHHELYVSPKGLEELLPKVAAKYDEPFGDTSSIPTSVLCEMARQYVTVALSGDGGDEQYYGYRHYLKANKYRRYYQLPTVIRKALVVLLHLAPSPFRRNQAFIFESPGLADVYARQLRSRVTDLMPGVPKELAGDLTAREVFARLGPGAWAKLGPAVDFLGLLPESFLMKVDRASMAASLEVRVPLLDHRFVEFSARVPQSLKYRQKTSKYLLRKVLAKYVPPALWERPKRGFSIPLGVWFRKELRGWVHEILSDRRDWTFGLISRPRTESILDQHMRGELDHSRVIWMLISWKLWAEKVGLVR